MQQVYIKYLKKTKQGKGTCMAQAPYPTTVPQAGIP